MNTETLEKTILRPLQEEMSCTQVVEIFIDN